MKHLLPVLAGGYPFDDVSIAFIQAMFNERDAFVYAVFGDKKKFSGIIENQQTNIVSDGLLTYNGKLYHFVGGAKQEYISLKKNITQRQFEDQGIKDAFVEEYFSFDASGTDVLDFSELTRYYSGNPIYKEVKWVGNDITNVDLAGTGWFVANGQNNTDNLMDRFVVSAGNQYQVGSIGGQSQVTLTGANLPKVADSVYVGEDGDGWPDDSGGRIAEGNENSYVRDSKKLNLVTGANNQAHENRPPYFALKPIQFIGID